MSRFGETLEIHPFKFCLFFVESEGRGSLGEGRLGVPSQVWEFRIFLSFPLFPSENRSSRNVWENTWKSQTSVFQTSAAFFSGNLKVSTTSVLMVWWNLAYTVRKR